MQNIAKSLAKFHTLMKPVSKDGKNPFLHNSYATLDNILQSIKQPLQEAGLVISQIPVNENELRTVVLDVESGEMLEGTFKLTPTKNDPQSQGSVITYARRYALSAMLGLSTEEDDDGNKATARMSEPVQTTEPTIHPLEPTNKNVCPTCQKEHSGKYPKCWDCYTAGKR